MDKISNKKNRLYYPYDKYAAKLNLIIDKAEDVRSTDVKKLDKDQFINNNSNKVIIDGINKLIDGEDIKIKTSSLVNNLDKVVVEKINEIGSGEPEDPNYVDLGLPSGTLWAKCNLGASSPWEYGDYYMWGSITPNTNDVCDWTHAPYQTNPSAHTSVEVKFTKYLGSASSSYKDSSATNENALKTVLDHEDDVAYITTNGTMRTPTQEEQYELLNCTINTWTTENGVKGMKFTNKTDDTKYIFIPASSIRNGEIFVGQGFFCYISSSSLNKDKPHSFHCAYFDLNSCYIGVLGRQNGCVVRPVKNK